MLLQLLSMVFSLSSYLFWGFQGGIIAWKKQTCCIKWTEPILSLIVSFLRGKDHRIEGMGGSDWRCYPFEDCNLRLDSNQTEFLRYGVRAHVPFLPAFYTPDRVIFSFMFLPDIFATYDIKQTANITLGDCEMLYWLKQTCFKKIIIKLTLNDDWNFEWCYWSKYCWHQCGHLHV